MSIESRMDEFEKVSHKEEKKDVKQRMDEFEEVANKQGSSSKEKSASLPYGLKRYNTCPYCGEFMEIDEVQGRKGAYKCLSCKKEAIIEAK